MARPPRQRTPRRDDRRTHPADRPRTRPVRRIGPWKHGNGAMPVVGLVGGIGAGKSTAAALLEARGAVVLEADKIGHALIDQPPSQAEVLRRFGDDLLIRPDDGPPRIDRAALGAIVFARESDRRDLERILHPRMRHTVEKAIARASRRGAPAVVLDAAILYEAGWAGLCDLVAFVDAPVDVRLARVAAARGWSADDLAAREAAQSPLDSKRSRADLILTNDADPDRLVGEVERLWECLSRPAQGPRPDRRPARPPGEPAPPGESS